MITYVFPPAAWVGAHRSLKYCKYLGRHGWQAVVLTADPREVTFKDDNLLAQLPPDVRVHRTFDLDPAKWEQRMADRKLARMRAATVRLAAATPVGSGGPPVSTPPPTPGLPTGNDAGSTLVQRIKRLVKALLKESPDSHLFWVPFAVFRGVWILLTSRVDVIYSSTPPHSSHMIAFLLAKLSGKPYVLDFRDPWYVAGSAIEPRGKIPTLLRLETATKRLLVRHAARVICVSKGEQAELQAEFPDIDGERFTHITNGFDPEDFEPLPANESPRSGKLRIIHAGTIYAGIAGEFFGILSRLVHDYPDEAAGIEVNLVGEIDYEFDSVTQELERAGILRIHGLQPHTRTLQMMRDSDVLLILMGGNKYRPSHLPSKGFEYLQAGKPILAITHPGELADLVEQSGLGIVVSPRSIDTVVQTLRELRSQKVAGSLARTPNADFIKAYERPALAAKLAQVLDEVAGGRP